MIKNNIFYDKVNTIGTIVHIAINSEYKGNIIISDEIKENVKEAIVELKNAGIKKTVMLTGDSKEVAEKVANDIGIDEVYQINLFAIGDVFPDTTIFFDIPYEIGLERINKNHRDTDRLDLESNDFHKKVYEGYMSICEKYADRITKIDASKSIDEVASQVIDIIKKII